MSSPQPRWLDAEQQRVWRTYLLGAAHLNDRLDADLRCFGLDLNEYEILVRLSEAPQRRLRMSDLASLVHNSRSRLTHTVGRLERGGLITRVPADDDRRGVVAVLTSRGFDLLEQAAPSHVAAVRRHFVDVIPEPDFEALGRAFAAVLSVTD